MLYQIINVLGQYMYIYTTPINCSHLFHVQNKLHQLIAKCKTATFTSQMVHALLHPTLSLFHQYIKNHFKAGVKACSISIGDNA